MLLLHDMKQAWRSGAAAGVYHAARSACTATHEAPALAAPLTLPCRGGSHGCGGAPGGRRRSSPGPRRRQGSIGRPRARPCPRSLSARISPIPTPFPAPH